MALMKIWFYKLNWKSWDFVVTMAVACKKQQKYTMPEIQAKKLLMLMAHLIPDINGISIMFWYLTMCLLGRKADQKKNLKVFTFPKLVQVTEHTGRIMSGF